MGFKRTFDAEEVQELNFKHARQISFCNKLAKLDGGVPCPVSLERTGDDLCGFKCDGDVSKGLETNAPFSWITTSVCEDEAQSGATTQSSLSPESPETDFPWTRVCPPEDVNWCQMSPRKQVPIGMDYQADIPDYVKKEEVQDKSDHAIDLDEERVLGKCVIPMPDSETDDPKVGKGREECLCLDKGSIRCVQQHIMKNREDLFETIGYERCLSVGLCGMGEEVADKLTEDEEDLFHEIVYSNPVSQGRDFWKHLRSAFPSRTMKEIVSYYFNVFILRRRAVQNRSKYLDVDSDDDEWQVEYDNTFGGADDADDDDEGSRERLSRDEDGEVNAEDDSCMSFDFQSSVTYPRCPAKANIVNCWRNCNDLADHTYSFDSSDDSILPDRCWSRKIDLLPTSNMIDEIFGQENPWDDFSKGK